MKLYTYVQCSLYVFQFWYSWQTRSLITTVPRFTRIPTYGLRATQYQYVVNQIQIQRELSFYSQILQNGNLHPDGKQSTRYWNKCNLILQVVNYVKTGIHINCTEHKCTISYKPRKQLSPTENIMNDYLLYPLSNQASNVSIFERVTYAHPC